MGDTVKLIIEIPKVTYKDLKSGKIYSSLCEAPQGLVEGIQKGTPLDSNSERAEVQAYFAGQAYGWEQGRKALIDELKTEIRADQEKYSHPLEIERAIEILDNIGKTESEGS